MPDLDALYREIEAVAEQIQHTMGMLDSGMYLRVSAPSLEVWRDRLRALLPREETLADLAWEIIKKHDSDDLCSLKRDEYLPRLRAALARERERGRNG